MLSFFFGVSNQRQFMKSFVLFYCQPCLSWVEQRESEGELEREIAALSSLAAAVAVAFLLYTLPVTLLHSLSRSCCLCCALCSVALSMCVCARTHDLFLALTHPSTVAAAALQLHSCLSSSSAAVAVPVVVSISVALLLFLLLCCVLCAFLVELSSSSCVYATFTNRTLQKVEVNLPRSCGYCCWSLCRYRYRFPCYCSRFPHITRKFV